MPLTFDTSKIDPEITTRKEEDGDYWSYTTESVIWHTMFVGMNDIKDEATAQKFYERYTALNIAMGVNLPYFLSAQDIHNHIGLTSNASTLTDAAFRGKLIKAIGETAKRRADQAWNELNIKGEAK